jgi:pyruvate formate lyase activating enzyme
MCRWCANPESQEKHFDILLRQINCIGCGACVSACPNHALKLADGMLALDRSLCERCGACAEVCNANGITLVGREVTVEELYREIIQDRLFFDTSGGGVTFSGGEPLMQPEFLKAILQKCKVNHLHTVIETCGYAPEEVIKDILPFTDSIFYDIKIMDPMRHKAFTGVTNESILSNLKIIAAHQKEVLVRTPIIPGINDDEENIRAIGQFLKSIGITTMQILPYHPYGVAKYEAIGHSYQVEAKAPTEQTIAYVVHLLEEYGINAIV